jgi:hypothetical protein
MRRIIYLKTGFPLAEEVLEECSIYTPLVEPQGDSSLFCDLSGCGPTLDIIKSIVGKHYHLTGRPAQLALASSRLVAENALGRSQLPRSRVYRKIKTREAIILEVLPGLEAEFISSIPLSEFTAISLKEARKLERAGLSTLGELKTLGTERMIALLGKRGVDLLRQLQGIDDRPILGLYPPRKISYPLLFNPGSEAINDLQMKEAGRVLQALLEKRHSACAHITLELKVKDSLIRKERRLKGAECRGKVLSAAFMEMFQKAELEYPPEEGTIVLSELSPLEWQEADLFSLLPRERNGCKWRVEKTIEKLDIRFPGQISWGKEEGRREKVLAYFDPWRLNPITH